MSNLSLTDRLFDVCAAVLGVPVSSLSESSSPDTIAEWDSVNHLSIIMAVEAEFGVQFDPSELMEFRSIGAIAARVRDNQPT